MPGSLIACASFLSSSRNRESVRASQSSMLAVFGPQELDALMVWFPSCLVVDSKMGNDVTGSRSFPCG